MRLNDLTLPPPLSFHLLHIVLSYLSNAVIVRDTLHPHFCICIPALKAAFDIFLE